MGPLQTVTEVSRIAYGFMASKALFAALDLDLFTHLSEGPLPLDDLCQRCGISSNRLETLLAACVGLRLLQFDGTNYAAAPVAQSYLSRSSALYYGDYFRYQTDRQIYPSFDGLGDALRGEPRRFYELALDPRDAEQFSQAQYSGSLGPARLFAKRHDLSQDRKVLDVAGGSGAFAIALCQRYPQLEVTIIDFPNMTAIAQRNAAEAGVGNRVSVLSRNAFELDWPQGQDAVLMSYLLYCVDGQRIPELMRRAFAALRPGGRLYVHDFVVDDDHQGPSLASLWLVSSLLADPDAVLLTPARLASWARDGGFTDVAVSEHIAELTKVMTATRPLAGESG